MITLVALLLVVEVAQLGVSIWAQLHRRTHSGGPFGRVR